MPLSQEIGNHMTASFPAASGEDLIFHQQKPIEDRIGREEYNSLSSCRSGGCDIRHLWKQDLEM